MKYVNDEFEEAWIALKQPIEIVPDPDALSFYKESQKERDIFREFHREHSTSTSAGSPYQCTLISKGNEYILSKAIPYDTYKFQCDCDNPIRALVPKSTFKEEMKYDVYCNLVAGHFDYLFTSLYSVPSID